MIDFRLKKEIIFVFFAFLISENSRATFANWNSVNANRQGAAAIKEQDLAKAQEMFGKAMAEAPFIPEIQLNLGLTFQLAGLNEKASASYNSVLQPSEKMDPKLSEAFLTNQKAQFMAAYNLGTIYQKDQEVDQALAAYQKALEIDPTSRETKVNIELLIKKQQQQGGKGGQDNKDQNKNQDQKNENQDNKDQDKKDQEKKEYAKNKPQPRQFKSQELSQNDVNKILAELKQQEQRIRADFNKREVKEKPRDKDW